MISSLRRKNRKLRREIKLTLTLSCEFVKHFCEIESHYVGVVEKNIFVFIFCDYFREQLIDTLKQQVADLSLYLEEERLNHKDTKKKVCC